MTFMTVNDPLIIFGSIISKPCKN